MSDSQPVVVDASAALAWVLDESTTPAFDLASPGPRLLIAPPLWVQEVANAVLVKTRRKVISPETASEAISLLDQLEVAFVQPQLATRLPELAELAGRHQLSSYDATYLALALEQGALLRSNDANLLAAAHREGIATAPSA